MDTLNRILDLRDIKVFHSPQGCRASSLVVKEKTESSARIYIDYIGRKLPDYAGAYIGLENDNWENLYSNGVLMFNIGCTGDFIGNIVAIELNQGVQMNHFVRMRLS